MKIISQYVYPSVRKRLVEILYYEKKLKQEEIAKKLYISQSAVSKYVKGNRGRFLDVSTLDGVEKDLKEFAEIIMHKNLSKAEVEYYLSTICFRAMGRGEICEFHDKIDGGVSPLTCNLCNKLFGSYLESERVE